MLYRRATFFGYGDCGASRRHRILVMGVNPGHIKEDIAINLKRPRHIDDTLTPEFIQISRQVLATIREETLKSMEC